MGRPKINFSPFESEQHFYFLWAVYNLEATGEKRIDPVKIVIEMDNLRGGNSESFLEFLGALIKLPQPATLHRLVQELRDEGFIAARGYTDLRNPDFPEEDPDEIQVFADAGAGGYAKHITLNHNGRTALARLFEKNGIDPKQYLPEKKGHAR